MIAIVILETGAVERLTDSIDGRDMDGRVAVAAPDDFDPIAPSHVLVDGEWLLNLDALRLGAIAAANARAEQERALHLTPGAGQAMTYLRKEDEARRFAADGEAGEYPFLTAEAASTGASLADTAALVLAQANAWAMLGAAIEGHRRGLIVAIEAARDAAEIEAIDIAAGWPAPTI